MAAHIVKDLLANENYRAKNYEKALIEVFLDLDNQMLTEEEQKNLLVLAKEKQNGRELIQKPRGDEPSHAGCTATTVLLTEDKVICANAGDSRTVYSAHGGPANGGIGDALSEDHQPDVERERKRIEAAGLFVSQQRVKGQLAVSRALGDFEYKQ